MATAPVVISADRVLPGDGTVVEGGTVTIVGDRITALGAPGPAADGAQVLRMPGCTILPGLINTHVHLCFAAGSNPAEDVPARTGEELTARMAAHARILLAQGVTTARDLGDHHGASLAVRARLAHGTLPGPRLLVSGPPITPPQGHCWFLGGVVDGRADVERHIGDLARRGVDWIKVMASGGHITSGGAATHENQFTEAELAHVVDAAARHGLPVAAHAHGAEAIRRAVAAGVRTVEHCSLLDVDGSAVEFDESIPRAMTGAGTAACIADSHDLGRLSGIVGARPAADLLRRGRWLLDRGVPLIAGTDAGVTRFDGSTANLVRRGDHLDPHDVLATATTTAAATLGLADETGTLRSGLAADLLVVRGNPLDDLTALRRRRLIVARGRMYSPVDDRTVRVVAPSAGEPRAT